MIRSTLVSDGPSDRVLTKIIDWTLFQCGVRADLISQWADLRGIRVGPGLRARVVKALDLYPCDLLFIHRDAEAQSREMRLNEIASAVADISAPPYVAVIPVRMQEAWLLCDESAIREAASNPLGAVTLSMPRLSAIESLPDPKATVSGLLKSASEKSGRRLKQFNVEFARSQIAEHIIDYSQLRTLPSFGAFEAELRAVVQGNHFGTWL